MNATNPTKESIKSNIRDAIKKFIKKDKDSLTKINVHEAAISHRIAVYLEPLFPKSEIDCEYNKHHDGTPKQSGGKKIRPDIIIHNRLGWDAIAIFEIKKSGPDAKLGMGDIQKLKKAQKKLKYKIGVYIGVLKKVVHIVWISNGKELSRETL